MSAQPEALRLAQALNNRQECEDEAADELRRLYEAHDWQYKMAGERLRRIEKLEAQRDALLKALKLAWPIIEKEKFMQDGCYGKNFIQSKAERARKAYEAARAAIKAVEGEKT